MKLLHISGSHARNVEFIVRACKLFNIEYYHTDDTFPVDINPIIRQDKIIKIQIDDL